MDEKNYLKNNGNGNVILQGIGAGDININQITAIKKALIKISEETRKEISAELKNRFDELSKENELGVLRLQKILSPVNISNSKNVNTGNFTNNRGVRFGDDNYSYSPKIVIYGGFDAEELKKFLDDESYSQYFSNFSVKENPVYKSFLGLDREITNDLINEFEDNQTFFYFKTFNKHQPDWLFDRFVMQLEETFENKLFQTKTTKLWGKLDFRNFKRALKTSFKLNNEVTAQQILNTLDENTHNLLHFVIDIDTSEKKLKQFEYDFFNFWTDKESNIENSKNLIFLSVKIRKKPVTWFWQKKQHIKNTFLKTDLNKVNQYDIDRFFENYLKNINTKVKISDNLYIQELWDVFVPEIYNNILKFNKNA